MIPVTLKCYSTSALTIYLMMCLMIVATPFEKINAGGISGDATEATQQRIARSASVSAVQETASAGSNAATAAATASLYAKENVLDAIAWSVAKQMVSNMTRSLINWVNSGFEGSPAFVTDFKQMLIDSLDQAAGEYIQSLGGIGEFICSPFKLDVQAALTVNYAQARSGLPAGGDENQCTATGIVSNVENFLAGTADSWGDWLEITANPENTPYGAYLAAEYSLNVRLRNEAGQEIEYARYGDGFLSQTICQAIEGTNRENCTITKPGQMISQLVNFQLQTGQRSLIEADEINELIGAFTNQAVLFVVEGLNGLLGLSEPGYNGGQGSYLDQMVAEENTIDYTAYKKEMDDALALEISFLELIRKVYENTLVVASSTTPEAIENRPVERAEFTAIVADARTEQTRVVSNIAALNVLISRYTNASTTAASNASTTANQIRQQVVLDFIKLQNNKTLSTKGGLEVKRVEWGRVINPYLGGNPLE
jgi:hypothetical protein